MEAEEEEDMEEVELEDGALVAVRDTKVVEDDVAMLESGRLKEVAEKVVTVLNGIETEWAPLCQCNVCSALSIDSVQRSRDCRGARC